MRKGGRESKCKRGRVFEGLEGYSVKVKGSWIQSQDRNGRGGQPLTQQVQLDRPTVKLEHDRREREERRA